jgi:hypothetical protein
LDDGNEIEEEAEELKGSNEAEEARIERQLARTRAPSKYFNEHEAPMMDFDTLPPPSTTVPRVRASPERQQPIVHQWTYRLKPTRPLQLSQQVVHMQGYLVNI